MKTPLLSLLLASVSLPARTQAADTAETGKLTLSGYLNSHYLRVFNRPKSSNLLGVD